ncbi:MAG: caspase family protein [Bacteroidales bacterium]|nr:caspase family protein [Bacteroidales bacterium]
MKSISIFLVSVFLSCSIYGQVISGKSASKKVTFSTSQERSVVTKLPDLIIQGERFSDENENNFIDAAEKCFIGLNVENIGEGLAESVKVKLSTKNGNMNGLSFNSYVQLGDIAAHSSQNVTLPVNGEVDLTDGLAEFMIEVFEDRGFDAFPLEIKIETKAFATPDVIVADAVFSTEDGGLIKLNYPINLKVIVQNIGQGDAKNVKADFNLPNPNCVFLGEENNYDLGILKRGESRELEFLFTATRRYTLNEIPVLVDIKESFNKYAKDTTLYVGLEQRLTARNEVVISGIATETQDIVRASLTSEVDKNIPVNMTKHPYRYALIIGNEDYSRFQRGLDNESNVEFARNDAKIFKDYAVKTLGVDDMNAHLLQDATAGEIYQKIDLVSKLASKTGEQAEIIFFYAGHGLPDEVSRSPYLIPVDVAGSNLNAAIKLEDIYKKFAESGAGKVSVFLDACFSGGGRDAGLLAARSVKVKPKKDLISGNLVVFSASTGEQSALPIDEEQHGMFSFYLLKKLKESKGNVTYGELSDYISKNVSIESLRVNQKEQDPTVSVSPQVEESWRGWGFN